MPRKNASKYDRWGIKARELYVELGHGISEICEMLPRDAAGKPAVSAKTLHLWCADGGWVKLRREFIESDANEYLALTRDCRSLRKQISDAIAKNETDGLTARIDMLSKLDKVRREHKNVDMKGMALELMFLLTEYCSGLEDKGLLQGLKTATPGFMGWIEERYKIEDV